jgi:hypothetical protein
VGDKEVLERVQRRAVGMVTNYEARLAEARMTTLNSCNLGFTTCLASVSTHTKSLALGAFFRCE